jgi:hypothetical protein
MASTLRSIREELLAYETTDPVVASVLEETWRAVTESEAAASLDELHLCLVNPVVASPALKNNKYFTPSCQALRDEKLIVVNERFLLELEAAIRSFAQSETLLGSPYLTSDAQLFGLVRRIQSDSARYLARLRRQTQRSRADPDAEHRLRRELALVTLFFLGHELGHFLGGHPRGQFAAFVDPDTPLEQRIEDAVVKLCRHVDEFTPTQFGLPGFERAADASSDVRRVAEEYRGLDERRFAMQEAFFANEAQADAWADRIVIAHLDAVAQGDPIEAERSLYLLARGVFVAALYTWYRDLDVFGRKLGLGSMSGSGELGSAMVHGREQYIHAASLFGEHHRFTLLRAALALEAMMRARTRWFELPPNGRSIRCAHGAQAIAADQTLRREWWLSESLQRYFLLCICMDTAVKIAHVGCATGWIRNADRKRGAPQLLIMKFESIGEAVDRLRRIQ